MNKSYVTKFFIASCLLSVIFGCRSRPASEKKPLKGMTSEELSANRKDRILNIDDYLVSGKLYITIVTSGSDGRYSNLITSSLNPAHNPDIKLKAPIPGLDKKNAKNMIENVDFAYKYEYGSLSHSMIKEWLIGSGGQNGYLTSPKIEIQKSVSVRKNFLDTPDGLKPSEVEPNMPDQVLDLILPLELADISGTRKFTNSRTIPVQIKLILTNQDALLSSPVLLGSSENVRTQFSKSGIIIFNTLRGSTNLNGELLSEFLGKDFKKDSSMPSRTIFIQNRCNSELSEEVYTSGIKEGFDVFSMKTVTDLRTFAYTNTKVLAAITKQFKLSTIADAMSVPEIGHVAVWTDPQNPVKDISGQHSSNSLNLTANGNNGEVFDSGATTTAPKPTLPQNPPTPTPTPQNPEIPDGGSSTPSIPPIIPDDGIPDGDPLVLDLRYN